MITPPLTMTIEESEFEQYRLAALKAAETLGIDPKKLKRVGNGGQIQVRPGFLVNLGYLLDRHAISIILATEASYKELFHTVCRLENKGWHVANMDATYDGMVHMQIVLDYDLDRLAQLTEDIEKTRLFTRQLINEIEDRL